jgi:hypothetical protein
MSLVRPDDATEDELLAGMATAPLVGLVGHGAEFVVEGRGLLEEDGAAARVDVAAAMEGVQELARPAGMLVLMLARRPCTSLSALQAR